MRVAVIGNLTRDVVDGGAPRVGGAPFHAARALRLLGGRAVIVARCSAADRPALLPPLVALGVPVTWIPAASTMCFTLRYDGEHRTLELDALGEPWTPADVAGVERSAWVQVGALSRADFPPDVMAALARDRRLALDAQGLVRAGRTGPVVLDGDFDASVLQHVTVLKVAGDEAEALGGEERLLELGHPRDPAHAGLAGRRADRRRPARADSRPARRRRRRSDGRRRRLPRGVRVGPRLRSPAALGRPSRRVHGGADARADARKCCFNTKSVIALVRTVEGTFAVDVEDELVLGESGEEVAPEDVGVTLPRLVGASSAGAVVIAVVDRRPPLVVSGDGGATWREAGGGLPAGFAVAIDPADPDRILYAARNRLYLSTDGGRFWRSLEPELPDIEALAWVTEAGPTES